MALAEQQRIIVPHEEMESIAATPTLEGVLLRVVIFAERFHIDHVDEIFGLIAANAERTQQLGESWKDMVDPHTFAANATLTINDLRIVATHLLQEQNKGEELQQQSAKLQVDNTTYQTLKTFLVGLYRETGGTVIQPSLRQEMTQLAVTASSTNSEKTTAKLARPKGFWREFLGNEELSSDPEFIQSLRRTINTLLEKAPAKFEGVRTSPEIDYKGVIERIHTSMDIKSLGEVFVLKNKKAIDSVKRVLLLVAKAELPETLIPFDSINVLASKIVAGDFTEKQLIADIVHDQFAHLKVKSAPNSKNNGTTQRRTDKEVTVETDIQRNFRSALSAIEKGKSNFGPEENLIWPIDLETAAYILDIGPQLLLRLFKENIFVSGGKVLRNQPTYTEYDIARLIVLRNDLHLGLITISKEIMTKALEPYTLQAFNTAKTLSPLRENTNGKVNVRHKG